MAQLVKRPTLAQVMNLPSMNPSPTLGSVLTAQNLEPVSLSLCPSPAHTLSLSLSLSKIIKNKKKQLLDNLFKF